jgi:hypothetical protein
MRQNIRPRGTSSEKTVKDIRRATRIASMLAEIVGTKFPE